MTSNNKRYNQITEEDNELIKVNNALSNGQTDIKELNKLIKEHGCDKDTLNLALSFGITDINFLTDIIKKEGCDQDTIDLAVYNGITNFDFLNLLKEYNEKLYDKDVDGVIKDIDDNKYVYDDNYKDEEMIDREIELKLKDENIYDKDKEIEIVGDERYNFKITNKLTKYEKARIVGVRTSQINLGYELYITKEELGDITDPLEIATLEINKGQLPLIIKRILPNNKIIKWQLSEMEF